MKPTRYYIVYEVPPFGDDPNYKYKDFNTLDAAKKYCTRLTRSAWAIYERINISDITPEGDPRGLLYDYESKFVLDCSE